MDEIEKYFPQLTPLQVHQLKDMLPLYEYWNQRINVISRKDMDNFYERHVLHSLAIAKVIQFKKGATVLDVGTGGGFPGIPLAILFPETNFYLVDARRKKIEVVEEVVKKLQLTNVRYAHERAEDSKERFDFIVSRAVTNMPQFMSWVKGKCKRKGVHHLSNGILYLKGGDLKEELASIKQKKIYHLSEFYGAIPFYETKKIVYVPQ